MRQLPLPAGIAAQAAVDATKGIGTLSSYATEVALPVKGTWKNPVIGSARADIVVTAPDEGVPLLFIEVDNCTEEVALTTAKFDKYSAVLPTGGQGTPRRTPHIWPPGVRCRCYYSGDTP